MPTGMSEAEAQELAAKWVKKLQDALGPEYKQMIASYGGGEAYLRWVRGYDDPPSATDIGNETSKLPD